MLRDASMPEAMPTGVHSLHVRTRTGDSSFTCGVPDPFGRQRSAPLRQLPWSDELSNPAFAWPPETDPGLTVTIDVGSAVVHAGAPHDSSHPRWCASPASSRLCDILPGVA